MRGTWLPWLTRWGHLQSQACQRSKPGWGLNRDHGKMTEHVCYRHVPCLKTLNPVGSALRHWTTAVGLLCSLADRLERCSHVFGWLLAIRAYPARRHDLESSFQVIPISAISNVSNWFEMLEVESLPIWMFVPGQSIELSGPIETSKSPLVISDIVCHNLDRPLGHFLWKKT